MILVVPVDDTKPVPVREELTICTDGFPLSIPSVDKFSLYPAELTGEVSLGLEVGREEFLGREVSVSCFAEVFKGVCVLPWKLAELRDGDLVLSLLDECGLEFVCSELFIGDTECDFMLSCCEEFFTGEISSLLGGAVEVFAGE